MSPFIEQLEAGAVTCGLADCRTLVAVSGGADSVALLIGLDRLRMKLNLEIHVAHLDHGLRHESTADAEWVARLCRRLGHELIIERIEISGLAKDASIGLEEMARRVRYGFLQEIASRSLASSISVAHHADDQAETVLHHIVRGTGIVGLRGMLPARRIGDGILLMRPMLNIGRPHIEAFLADEGQDYLADESNFDLVFTRNRIRHELIPFLTQFNPQVVPALQRLASQAGEIEDMLDELASRILQRAILEQSPNVIRLDCREFTEQPRHLIRHCFVQLWTMNEWPRQKMTAGKWEQLAGSVESDRAIMLPGQIVVQRRGDLMFLQKQ
jgi:tRNA(Ile)-lysidine synthase